MSLAIIFFILTEGLSATKAVLINTVMAIIMNLIAIFRFKLFFPLNQINNIEI